MGLASYYQKNFAAIAKPLYQLTERFEWTDGAQTTFQKLGHHLVTAPTLAFLNYTQTFILGTDASDTGIGVILSQRPELMLYSHTLSGTTVLPGENSLQ